MDMPGIIHYKCPDCDYDTDLNAKIEPYLCSGEALCPGCFRNKSLIQDGPAPSLEMYIPEKIKIFLRNELGLWESTKHKEPGNIKEIKLVDNRDGSEYDLNIDALSLIDDIVNEISDKLYSDKSFSQDELKKTLNSIKKSFSYLGREQ